MRLKTQALGVIALACLLPLGAAQAKAKAHKPTAQEAHCSESATRQNLTGNDRATFIGTCIKGTGTASTPTGPTAATKEAQAVTKPSGVDRTTRTKQCAAEADRKGLAAKDRKAFQLSCLATAGPTSEAEAGAAKQPQAAHAIKGIGVNNNKPSATTAKSTSVAKPQD